MMDHGQPPDQKRPRIESWPNNLPQERPQQQERPHLPLPPPPIRQPYSHEGGSPFSGPENPLNPRRHSEQQTQYEPDPRRPNSGPHSGASHAYLPHHSHSAPQTAPPYVPPAVATMKRDPAEDQIQQYNRPSSRGNGLPEHNVGAPHPYGHHPPYEGQAPPPNVIPFRPPGGYANPQSPMAGGNEPYPHPNFGASPHQGQRPDMYTSVSYPQSGTNVVKRKATRAAQACDSCRGLKAKCDEGRPICSTCKEKGFPCVYRDPPPKQQDKTQTDILDGMLEMKTLFQNHMTRVDGMLEMKTLFQNHMTRVTTLVESLTDKVNRIEREIKPTVTQNPDLKEDERQHAVLHNIPAFIASSADSLANPHNVSESPHPSPSTPGGPPMRTVGEGIEAEEEAGDPVNPGPSSIPVNHTTGAARLLLVPQIAELAMGAKPYFANPGAETTLDKYPMLLEERRGLLRSFGRGEGLDRPPGYKREPLIDHGYEGTPSDTTSDPATPPGEEWGQIGGLTPPPDDAPIARIGENSRLGLGVNSEGLPDLSHDTIQLLVKSYIDNMNIMHPILVPHRLDALVDIFIRSIPETQSKYRPPPPPERVSAGFIGSRGMDSPGTKRKRSYAATVENFEAHSTWGHKPGHPFRSISTALVLFVMALGSICLHKEKISDVVSDKDIDDMESASPASRNGHPRSPLVPSATGLPSPQEADRMLPRSRRTSLDSPQVRPGTNLKLKNLDVIPGLSYFAIASDIIGNQIGGNSLQHVHANILAGLYHGQLGRVLESHAYIANACRALQVILRPKLDRFKKLKAESIVIPPRDNPLVFAFWTCLQLESDIVAELPVPMSGILTYEDDMPLPNVKAAVEEKFDPVHIESYMTQLNLRKHLNQLHTMFYKPDDTNDNQTSKTPYYPTIEAVETNLESIKSSTQRMNWHEDDPPAANILGARLRAKYYGAEVITYRSFVLNILIGSSESSPKIGATSLFLNQFKREITDPMSDPTRKEQLTPKTVRYAQRCIQALVKSTTAFHGLGDPGKERLIVTNIWGTAHAQWGNVLTLLAAYQDPVLSQWINGDHLKHLLNTTLSFLELHMQPSSALAMDHRVLKHVGRQTGLLLPKKKIGQYGNSSFGSNSSGDVSMSGY